MSTATTIRPVILITRKEPHQKPVKVARLVFPADAGPMEVVGALTRWPTSEGFRCELRQVGPQGFSLPLDRAAFFSPHPGLAEFVATL